MYNFLFDKRSLTLLVGGLAMAGALLFAAGLLLGVQWGMPAGTQTAAAPRPCPEPIVVAAALAAPAAPAATPSPPPWPVPESLAEPAPADDEAGEPAPAEPAAEPEPEPYAPSELAIGGPADGDGRFAVQVGAFANPANSRGMLETLARRGYDAYVVELAGGRRILHTVRFGRFAEHAQAAQAAADFRRKEGMEAVVQESDTL